jgi:hypothetical protein
MTLRRIKPVVPAVAPPGGCERLACCIPFCRRTFRNDKRGTPWPEGSHVICGKHWRLGSAIVRRRYSRLKRLHTRGPVNQHGSIRPKLERMMSACFDRVVRQATERAGGIG